MILKMYLVTNYIHLKLTYVSFATAFALTATLSCRNSCLISSIHCAIYFAYNNMIHI